MRMSCIVTNTHKKPQHILPQIFYETKHRIIQILQRYHIQILQETVKVNTTNTLENSN